MKRIFLAFFSFTLSLGCLSQEQTIKEVDSLYKEDQFYAGVTYNLLGKIPNNISQNGFSLGFHLGFINDIPINKKRNIALGIGLGYSANSFNQNLLIDKDVNGNYTFSVLENSNSFTKNKFSTHLIEVPFEFRWRTSTPTEYNFWRVYAGFKLGYVFTNTSKYNGELGSIKYTNLNVFNDFQYGLTFSAGYNTWNLYMYYALNPIFSKGAEVNNEAINMNAIKIGLMFYIL